MSFLPGLPCGAETFFWGVGATGLPVGQVPLGTVRMVDLRSDYQSSLASYSCGGASEPEEPENIFGGWVRVGWSSRI